MELFKLRKSPQEGPKIDWSKERSVFRILEHSKIIGVRKFNKNQMDHARSNFRMILAYGTLGKIVLGTEPKRGGYLQLIWPFWTQWQIRFVILECGLGDMAGQPLLSRLKIQWSRIKLI